MPNATQLNAFQSAWIVDDIYEAANMWIDKTGIGPFYITDYQEGALINTYYRGTPTPITMKTGLAQAGDMQIELIQPTGNQPNIYRDTVPMGRAGFHHIALWSNDVDADVAQYQEQGFEVAARGSAGGLVQFAYIDTSAVFGHMIELVEKNEIIQSVFAEVTEASKGWDGSDPIRTFADT